jgi:O-antigen ligase
MLACAIALPFLINLHRQPLSTFHAEWWAAALWLLVFTLMLQRANEDHSQRGIAAVILFPLGLAVLTLAQFVWLRPEQNDMAGLVPFAFALGAMAIGCGAMLRRQFTMPQAATLIAVALLVSSVLGMGVQLVQLFRAEFAFFGLVSDYFPTEQRRLWGNLNQPNHQATVHGLGLAALMYLMIVRRWPVVACVLAAIWILAGVILTGSRTGVVHLGLASVLGLLLMCFDPDDARARPRRIVVAVISLMLLPAYFGMQPLVLEASRLFDWKLFDAVARLEQGDAGSARAALWSHAWAMFRAHPWFGVGWMEFGFEQWRQLRAVGMKVELAQQAHNQLLDLLAKTGIVGAGWVAGTLGLWWWRVMRRHVFTTEQPHSRSAVLLGLAWLAMLCAHSMLEYPLHYLYFFLLFCFLLGWLEPCCCSLRGAAAHVAAWRGWAIVAVLVGSLGLAAVMLDYRRAEDVSRAAVFDPLVPERPRFWFRDVAEHRQIARMPITRVNAEDALARHHRALHVLPTTVLIQRTALLTAMQGDQQQAQEMLHDLPYYYWVSAENERLQLTRLCATLPVADRPRPYCPLP